MPTTAAVQSVQSVTFPALARIRDDPEVCRKLPPGGDDHGIRDVPGACWASAAVARDMFDACWLRNGSLRCPISRSCVAGLFYPDDLVAQRVLKVQCRGSADRPARNPQEDFDDPRLRRDDSPQRDGRRLGTWSSSPPPMAAINCWAARRFTILTMRTLPADLLPVTLVSAVMYAAVRFNGRGHACDDDPCCG